MRLGVSGTHGIGKTTLVEELCEHLVGHRTVDEPFYLLEEEGYAFEFPPSLSDYRAQLNRSLLLLNDPAPNLIFDRTPLDFLAYLAALGGDICSEVDTARLRSAFASLDLLVVVPITIETERTLPATELSGLRKAVNQALLDLVYDDPFDAWQKLPVVELDGPLQQRVQCVLTAARQR